MGRPAEKLKTSSAIATDDSASSDFSMDEDETDQASNREETPDLYRNSALGM